MTGGKQNGLGAETAAMARPQTFRAVWRQRTQESCPVDVFEALCAQGQSPAFLYSGEGFGSAGRYSFLALDPLERFSADASHSADPLAELRKVLAGQTWTADQDCPPVPFFGGWIGFVSYDLLHRLENVTSSAIVDHDFDLVAFTFYSTVLAYDHTQHVWTACRLIAPEDPTVPAERRLDQLLDSLSDRPQLSSTSSVAATELPISNFTQRDYELAVSRALDYIRAGDIYQVNLSQRFEAAMHITPEELACRLFRTSPAPFSAFLPLERQAVVSASPERFLQLRGRNLQTWPIKGTRPRGSTADEDKRLKRELLDSAKEKAELTMITDLLRNDIGRVCDFGSISVMQQRALASYQNVHHTFSKIVGRLRSEVDIVDLIAATFPGGSVTGVPKIRAMEIIDELEPTARGPYCGAIGYIGVDGTMDLNIAIRTILCQAGRLTFQVGGGIVADSRPADEYSETLDKARGIMATLGFDEE